MPSAVVRVSQAPPAAIGVRPVLWSPSRLREWIRDWQQLDRPIRLSCVSIPAGGGVLGSVTRREQGPLPIGQQDRDGWPGTLGGRILSMGERGPPPPVPTT